MSLWLALGSAFWLGLLCSISPCPLTTNIAAISFVGRQVSQPRAVLQAGLLYVLGRTLAYVLLAVILLAGLLASDGLSRWLQQYLNLLLGPLLIVVGLVLLEMLGAGLSLDLAGERWQARVAKGGTLWALPLGLIFALSFCPVSAGLYFGALLPLAIAQESRLWVPALFGVGTAIPVIVFAILIALGGRFVGPAFKRLTQIERWVRVAAGVVLVLAGVYLCLTQVYGLPAVW